jgi:hypothetical protein
MTGVLLKKGKAVAGAAVVAPPGSLAIFIIEPEAIAIATLTSSRCDAGTGRQWAWPMSFGEIPSIYAKVR